MDVKQELAKKAESTRNETKLKDCSKNFLRKSCKSY